MTRLLIINLFISLLWPTFNGDYSLNAVFIGFALGFIVLTIVNRAYGKLVFYLTSFFFYVLYAILQSNIKLARLVLSTLIRPSRVLRPGIVSVPLRITSPFERTLLASIITLTPGTLTVDLGARDGQDVLFVHTVDLADPVAFRRDIKENFEDRILHLHNLQVAMNGDTSLAESSNAADGENDQ